MSNPSTSNELSTDIVGSPPFYASSSSLQPFSVPPPLPPPIPTATQNTPGKGKRAGAPNYNQEDVDKLLEILDVEEPLGANDWALVESLHNSWATEEDRPVRDADSLKSKFDKLANTKKPTGNPSCPPNVREAKRIARNIMAKTNAIVAGHDEGATDEESAAPTASKRKRTAVGVSPRKRHAGARGLKHEDDDILVQHVGNLSSAICKFIEKKEESQTPDSSLIDSVRETVKKEIEIEVKDLRDTMNDVKSLLSNVFSKLSK